jgi:PAS domain S-box-containing protein
MSDPTVHIDQLLSSRKTLERVLDNLKEGLIAHDLKRRILFFNKEAERITGYTRGEVLGQDCHNAFGGPFCGDRCAFFYENPSLKEHDEYTLHITTKTGDTRVVDMSVSCMDDGKGVFFGVLASFRDMTDLIRLKMRTGRLTGFSGIIGNHSKMLQVFQQIQNVSEYDYPVNIFGETGTGKELVASAIHRESRRRNAPFVPINCGAIPEGLIESELFGHTRGAFSGAVRDKKGRFELADGGTLFLDEISELSKPMQVKLLRFLQEGTIEKVGAERTTALDVRVISATNVDLKQAIFKKAFREDLYYRLNVIPIRIPPLRERKTDIPLLIEHFLAQTPRMDGDRRLRISREALTCMMDYDWPGNVRELQNAVQFAVVKCNGSEIRMDDLPLELKNGKRKGHRRGPTRKLDAARVRHALAQSAGNKSKAAALLGVGRATLYRYLENHPEGAA